jgi:hypothetical protein
VIACIRYERDQEEWRAWLAKCVQALTSAQVITRKHAHNKRAHIGPITEEQVAEIQPKEEEK